jgi:ArsR family transcriptional regulator, arsenate/arsenite/antimonite-responsive transcriptional repressor
LQTRISELTLKYFCSNSSSGLIFLPKNSQFKMTPNALFKCLADDTRLRCLSLLQREGKLCVCELTYALNMLQPKISRHLATLRQNNLLIDSREGQWVYYQLNPELPAWIFSILAAAANEIGDKHQQDYSRLQSMPGRPSNGCCS